MPNQDNIHNQILSHGDREALIRACNKKLAEIKKKHGGFEGKNSVEKLSENEEVNSFLNRALGKIAKERGFGDQYFSHIVRGKDPDKPREVAKLHTIFAAFGLKLSDEVLPSSFPAGRIDLGREGLIDDAVKGGARLVLLHGEGGVGKSYAADCYLQSMEAKKEFGDSRFTVVAASQGAFAQNFATCVRKLCDREVWRAPSYLKELSKDEDWLNAFRECQLGTKVLIHLDNVGGPNAGQAIEGEPSSFVWLARQLPRHPSITYIFTSQESEPCEPRIFTWLEEEQIAKVYLKPLDRQQTLNFVRDRALGLKGELTNEETVLIGRLFDALSTHLGYEDEEVGVLPLDLDAVMGSIDVSRDKWRALDALVERFEADVAEFLEEAAETREARDRTGRPGTYAGLKALLWQLNNGKPLEDEFSWTLDVKALMRAAWLNAENIPLCALTDEGKEVEVLDRLENRRLLVRRPDIVGFGPFCFLHRTRGAMLRRIQGGVISVATAEFLVSGLAKVWSSYRGSDLFEIVPGHLGSFPLPIDVTEEAMWTHRVLMDNRVALKVPGGLQLPNRMLRLDDSDLEVVPDLGAFPHLKRLFLFSNQISEIKGLNGLKSLQLLDLNRNQIDEIKELDGLENLQGLFLRYNQIAEIKGLDGLENLLVLLLNANGISEIKGLDGLENLLILGLSANGISEIKNLDRLMNLKILQIPGNQISEIKGLDQLESLEELDLSHNEIDEIKGLDRLEKLACLDLSFNEISEIKGLDRLGNLQQLDLSRNQIREIKNLRGLKNLKRLNLRNNEIRNFEDLDWLRRLEWVNLKGNPGYYGQLDHWWSDS